MSFWLQEVLSGEHVLGNRMLEVKVATPKVTKTFHWNLKSSVVHFFFTFKKYKALCYNCNTNSFDLYISKEEMRAPAKKVTRIFVARIPQSVTEATFRRYISVGIFIKIIQTYEFYFFFLWWYLIKNIWGNLYN